MIFFLFFLSSGLVLGFWLLIVYVQMIVYYVFVFFSICRLDTFLLWMWCQASPHWISHLDSGQKMTSMNNMICYHHCDYYFSGRELQCQLTIIISLPQPSVLGSPLHKLNIMTLSPSLVSGSIDWQKITGLNFYLPCSVVRSSNGHYFPGTDLSGSILRND